MSDSIEVEDLEKKPEIRWSAIAMGAFNNEMRNRLPVSAHVMDFPAVARAIRSSNGDLAARYQAFQEFGIALAQLAKTESLGEAARRVDMEVYIAKGEKQSKDVRILGTILTALRSRAYMELKGAVAETRRPGQRTMVGRHP